MKITLKELADIITESIEKIDEQEQDKQRMKAAQQAAQQLKAAGHVEEAKWIKEEVIRTLMLGRDPERVKEIANNLKIYMKTMKTQDTQGNKKGAVTFLYPVYAWAMDVLEGMQE